MSEKEWVRITIEPDEQTWETIQLVAQAKRMSIEEVAEDFLLLGAVDRSVHEIIKAQVERGIKANKEEVFKLEKAMSALIEPLQQQLDSLETAVDKIYERIL